MLEETIYKVTFEGYFTFEAQATLGEFTKFIEEWRVSECLISGFGGRKR